MPWEESRTLKRFKGGQSKVTGGMGAGAHPIGSFSTRLHHRVGRPVQRDQARQDPIIRWSSRIRQTHDGVHASLKIGRDERVVSILEEGLESPLDLGDRLGILGTGGDRNGQGPQLPGIGIIILAKLESHPIDDGLEELDPKLVDGLADLFGLFPPDRLELAETHGDDVPDGVLGLASELGDEVERTRGLARTGSSECGGVRDETDPVLDRKDRVGLGGLFSELGQTFGRIGDTVYAGGSRTKCESVVSHVSIDSPPPHASTHRHRRSRHST